MTTIDQFVVDRGIQRVDLIKVDVEGTEDRVLAGAEQVVSRDRPIIICEVLLGRNEKGLQSILDAAGYRYAKITADGLCQQGAMCGHSSYADLNHLFWPQELDIEALLAIG